MLTTLVLFAIGLVLLVLGAELLVRGAASLAISVGIAPLVVGLTVVAYGTSAPELAVSVRSAFAGSPDLALGNVVGSNIFNTLVILGIAALCMPLAVARQLVRRDLWIMLGVSIGAFLLALDGRISRLDGLLLFAGAIVYTWTALRAGRRAGIGETAPDEPVARRYAWWLAALLVIVGLALLVGGAQLLVRSASDFARLFGVSELLIGLTIVAAGTSLPELATSAVAAWRGQRDIAIGNVVGSNIFNLLTVLGASAAIAPAGIPVAPTALHFDLPIMLLVTTACVPVCITGYRIVRLEGLALLACYIGYIVCLILASDPSSSLRLNAWLALAVGLPLILLSLLGFTARKRPAVAHANE